MPIQFHEKEQTFHIFNDEISYIFNILNNNQLGHLYYGKRITDQPNYSHLTRVKHRSLSAYIVDEENPNSLSLHHTMQEYPTYGTTDFRYPAYEIIQENGSSITNFEFSSYQIYRGKKTIDGLPATYVEEDDEATTLEIVLSDKLINAELILSYTIFEELPVLTRHSRFVNKGTAPLMLTKAMSSVIDFPDYNYEMVHLAGAWSRERHVKVRKLEQGVQSIHSMTGTTSAEHNPFIALKRPHTDENSGEAFGFNLVYSGNHLGQIEVDTFDHTRICLGIHPDTFEWKLAEAEQFQTPEVVMVYADQGLNKMSQAYHKLYRTRLARGKWRDKPRPVLVNNWEATEMEFTESQVVEIAKAGKALGAELFVLDDGWFGDRNHDRAGLGDWNRTNLTKLPEGIPGLASKIEQLGLKFGLWFEPEMVNKDSELYRAHPDWIIQTPDRSASPSRNQHVLDFSRTEVVDYIYEAMREVLASARISYVKWDMNRYITECFSHGRAAVEQGKTFHKYILGVYSLYERLINEFPDILFESCSSGGARFDPGMLYYAPQVWTSDDTDAIERLKIQYGTSYAYPLSSMGAHVSAVPNQQVGRITPIETRANVAMFGVFGYELDLNLLSDKEKQQVKRQIAFYKKHRKLILEGNFYRITSPFSAGETIWMVVSEDQTEAIFGFYKTLNQPNKPIKRFKMVGLDPDQAYQINEDTKQVYYGDALMYAGIIIDDAQLCEDGADFSSTILHLKSIR
ncbi:alpha-galactosidase [Natronobacillus azotifigens]|uniref:Alpha-galactosidase n=1 Tax=Natronobacillus azotifigens TaxID=472978 RepID=A0A9J6RAD7_9BACI|nr:alpha-galactosidase [Natronobacillus azotifigens]MCZ0702268.1 alpha-galactosidase [Natronobacillus azotifigens]